MNPEFLRNLWLELSGHRLVAMPAVLGIVFALVYVSSGDPVHNVAIAAYVLFFLLAGLVGIHPAAASVAAEIRGGTWDGQRMSALSPWEMAWGKLFGATALAWYGGLISLAVFLACTDLPLAVALRLALFWICSFVAVQASALILPILLERKNRSASDRWVGLAGVVAVLLGVLPFSVSWLVSPEEAVAKTIGWWGMQFNLLSFALAGSALFAAWAILGAWRTMAVELEERTTPVAWLAFSCFLTLYLGGFLAEKLSADGPVWALLLFAAFGVNLGLAYIMLFTESMDAATAGRLLSESRIGAWKHAVQDIPCWPVNLALAALAAVALFFVGGLTGDGSFLVGATPLALLFLALRDSGLLLFFAFARKPGKPELAAIIYLFLLYGPIPALLKAVGLDALAALVLPPFRDSPVLAAGIALIQAAIVFWFVRRRWLALAPAAGGDERS